MNRDALRGTGVALVTPFTDDKQVDEGALERLINHVIEGGVNYVVTMGTTGESATLSADEKLRVVKQTLEIVGGRVPVVLGHGGNNTAALKEGIQSYDLSGIAAILSVSPYYNKPTQKGIYAHYQALAAHFDKPIILYNVPGRTSSNIASETTLQLAKDIPSIIGIKEAAGDLVQVTKIVKDRPEGFLVISGDDPLVLPHIACGGDGVISVIANALPSVFAQMVDFALKGQYQEALPIHLQVSDLIDLLFVEGNPGGVKSALHALGLTGQAVRLPLVDVSEATYKAIVSATNDILQQHAALAK